MLRRRPVWERVLLITGAAAASVSLLSARTDAARALAQAWPPFALVAGLLVIGLLAGEDGLFRWAGHRLARLPGGNRVLLFVSMAVVAAVTAVLNLDTAVVFLTPTLVHVARVRGADEAPFLYGAVMMSNSASLLLPGSNLTNLIVLGHGRVAGHMFAARMAPAWGAAVVVTAAMVAALPSRRTGAPTEPPPGPARPLIREGVVATVVATFVILISPSPALPVLLIGVAALAIRSIRRALDLEDASEHLDVTVVAGLFGIVLCFGTIARAWTGPAHLLRTAGALETTGLGAVGAIAVNNLPAAMLLAARAPAHSRALLIGLNLGPNLAVTGSLSAVLWFRAARSVRARPSARRYSQIGIVLAPLSAVAALAALKLVGHV